MRATCEFLSEKTHRLFESFQVKQKSATVKSYAAEISFICSLFACDFLDLTAGQCEAYFEYLNGKVRNGELKVSTVTKKMHELSSFARFIALQGIGFMNPFAGLFFEEAAEEIPAGSIVAFPDLDRVLGVLKEGKDDATYFAVWFSVKLMLRMSELRLLKFSSFSFNESANECFVRITAENGSVRYIKVPHDLYLEVDEFHKRQDGYIISRTGQKPENSRWLQRHLKDACEKAGIETSFNYQDLRNTGIYVAGRNGVEVFELSEQLGHRSDRHIKRLENIGICPIAATDYVNIYIGEVSDGTETRRDSA